MNRYGRHTLAAFDASMRASLPALDATEGPQDAAKVLRGHEIRIADGGEPEPILLAPSRNAPYHQSNASRLDCQTAGWFALGILPPFGSAAASAVCSLAIMASDPLTLVAAGAFVLALGCAAERDFDTPRL